MRQTNTCDFRKKWMAVLAKADWSSLNSAWKNNSIKPDYSYLRKAETGLVMVEGRMGGSGQPFNLGELAQGKRADIVMFNTRDDVPVIGQVWW